METVDYLSASVPIATRNRRRTVLVIVLAAVALGVVGYLAVNGWQVRKAAWDFFAPLRFRYDIQRNYYFGSLVLRDGWLNLYEDQGELIREGMKIENPRQRREALSPLMNYSPLRALIFSRWAASTGQPERTPTGTPRWQENSKSEPNFNAWLSNFNSGLALAGAVAAGLLVHHWSRRRRDPLLPVDDRTHWQLAWPFIAGVIAFAAFWYNPAGLLLAHGWPSPNAWVLPFFLWALLFASWNCWFVSGVVIGVGAMAQGQHLLVAPFFLLWPLLALQPMRAVRWLSGFGIAFMGIVSGWILTYRTDLSQPQRLVNWGAVWWIALGALAVALLPVMRWGLETLRRRREAAVEVPAADDSAEGDVETSVDAGEPTAPLPDDNETDARPTRGYVWNGITLLMLAAVVAALSWPLLPFMKTHAPAVLGALMWTTAAVCLIWFIGWRAARYAVPAIVAIQLLLCMWLYDTNDAWFLVGFKYGAERHYELAVGTANNLGALLRESYGFRDIDETMLTMAPVEFLGMTVAPPPADGTPPGFFHRPVEISLRALMLAIYGLALLLASLATAIQWRRRDPNFLLAASVPWLLMALLPAQMHERYLGFAGLAAAVWIGARGGIGWALLGGFVSFVAYAQTANCMKSQGRAYRGDESFWHFFYSRDFFDHVSAATPDVSWALLLAMLMVLFASFLRGRAKQAKVVAVAPAAQLAEEAPAERPLLAEPVPA